MAVLHATDIDDMVAGTLKHMRRNKFSQIATELQNYEMMSRWLRKEKVIMSDGLSIEETLMYKVGGNAKWTGLWGTDDLDFTDHLKKMEIPWRYIQTYWAYDVREQKLNSGKSMVQNILKPRRIGAIIDMAALLEEGAWTAPAVADNETPYGLPYYIVKNAAEGFNGGLPGAHTTIAGIDLTEVPTFKNWTGQYVDVSTGDLLLKMRKGALKTKFKAPVGVKEFRGYKGNRYRWYMNADTLLALTDLATKQNDNIGPDLGKMDGMTTFNGNPLVYVPYLDLDTTNPLYGIDHGSFFVAVLKGNYLTESKVATVPGRHNVRQQFVDLAFNFVCRDRRANLVFHV